MSFHRSARPKRRNYDDEAIDLLRMIDIAVESCGYITSCYDGYQDVRRGELHGLRQRILHARPEERTLRVLDAMKRELLKYYHGLCLEPDTRFFWATVEAENLAERRDYVARALKRGRIVSGEECDCIMDTYMEQLKEGRITETQMRKVQRMIQAFIS